MRDGVVFIQSEEEKRRYLNQYHPKCTLYTRNDILINDIKNKTVQTNEQKLCIKFILDYNYDNTILTIDEILFEQYTLIMNLKNFYSMSIIDISDVTLDILSIYQLSKDYAFYKSIDNIINYIYDDSKYLKEFTKDRLLNALIYDESKTPQQKLTLEEEQAIIKEILNYNISINNEPIEKTIKEKQLFFIFEIQNRLKKSIINKNDFSDFNLNELLDDDSFKDIIIKVVPSIYNELSHPTNVKFRRDDFFIPRNNNEEGEKQYLSQFFNENCSNILFTSINNVIFKYEYYKEFFFIETDYLNDGLFY